MLILSTCKLLLDLLMYWIFGGVFFSHILSFREIVVTLVCCTFAEVLFRMFKSKFRYILFLILIIPQFLPEINLNKYSLLVRLILLIPAIYTIYLSHQEGAESKLFDFKEYFIRLIIAGFAATIFGKLYDTPNFCFILFFIFVGLGIFSLQLFRLYESGGLSTRLAFRWGVIMLGLALVILFFASPTSMNIFGTVLSWIYMNIIVKILTVFVYIIVFIVGLIWKGIAWIFSCFDIKVGNGIQINDMSFDSANVQNQIISGSDLSVGIWPKVLAVALLLIACFLFFRKLSKNSNNVSFERDGIHEERMAVKNDRQSISSTQKSIRKYYRKHMIFLEKNGAELDCYSTTTDVVREDGFSEESISLRDLYRRTRYAEEQLTSEEVHYAKGLIKSIEGK